MSKGLGKVEKAVLDAVNSARVYENPHIEADLGLIGPILRPVRQEGIVNWLAAEWQKPAIRRAIITLVRKGLLYKFDDTYGVLIDTEPIMYKLTLGLRSLKLEVVPVEMRRALPDFEPLIIEELKKDASELDSLARKVLYRFDGCYHEGRCMFSGKPFKKVDEASRVAFVRAVERMAKEGKVRIYWHKEYWDRYVIRGNRKVELAAPA